MSYPVLHAKLLNLLNGETLVVRFATKPEDNEPEFSGELRISFDWNFLPPDQRDGIKKTLAQVAPFVTTYFIV